ncbi:MAG: tetratricopeptide repeat protein [Pseudomonadota bacterium]
MGEPRWQAALYGRFMRGARAQIVDQIHQAGGRVVNDLTRSTDCLIVGAGAINFIANGHLAQRLALARARHVRVVPEARIASVLGDPLPAPTLPVKNVGYLPEPVLDLLNAFGLIHLAEAKIRFADAAVLKSAIGLLAETTDLRALTITLLRHQDAPAGPHKLVTSDAGEPLLMWDDGVTTMDGQGLLDLETQPPLADVFEAAMMAEAEGDLTTADRLYATCARADKRDPIAPFNRANVLVQLGDLPQAAICCRQAIDRDSAMAEAHYNLAGILERQDDLHGARRHLDQALAIEPSYADALFNLAQLHLRGDHPARAKPLFETFLATSPSPYWAQKARAGIAIATKAPAQDH